jgi:hypothetical protein
MSESAERRAEKRAQYLTATTELEYRKAHALAYCEQGCNERSIAQAIGSTKTTVANYLDEIAAQYGPDTVVSVGVDEKADLVPVADQPSQGPTETVLAGRKVVIDGASNGPHTAERYYRTWVRDGRIHRDAKVALSLHYAADGETRERLGNLEWDAHHCTYNPEYEFVSAGDDGAWTFDADRTTVSAVRDIAHVPPVETLPLVAETLPRREDADPFACVNPDCSSNRAHADKDLQAYPELSGPAIDIVAHSDVASHVCLDCRSLFTPVPVGPIEDGTEDGTDASDNILTEVMQQ